jgi:hypothetical protein
MRIVVCELEIDLDREPIAGALRRQGVPSPSFEDRLDIDGAIEDASISAGLANAVFPVRPSPANRETP